MNATEFHEKLKESGIRTAEVLKVILNDEKFKLKENRDKYPQAFDANGKPRLKFTPLKKSYNDFCPFPEHNKVQTKGDAFEIKNEDQRASCYGGCTTRPLNLVDLVVCLIYDVSPKVAIDRNLSGEYFWPAAKYLVKHFGDKLGLKLSDLRSNKGFVEDKTQKVLKATVDYYHYLGTKSNHTKRLDDYYLEERCFKYAPVDFQTLKEKSLIGITPYKGGDRNKLYLRLKSLGFSDEEILAARVCKRDKEDPSKIIDFYWDHYIIPYISGNKILGLYGRNELGHLRLSGYYDTPASLHKITNEKMFFVVEGDNTKQAMIAMRYENVMETMGANGLKEEHVYKIAYQRTFDLSKMQTAILVLDPDDTGREATLKIGKMLQDIAGIKVMVVRMPVLEKDGKPWHLDVNDLFKAYKEKAPEVFKELLNNAISLDAFSLLELVERENITSLADARMAIVRHGSYLDYVPALERVFIIEEFINLIYPSFEQIGLDKNLLRGYLKEVWLNKEVKVREKVDISKELNKNKEINSVREVALNDLVQEKKVDEKAVKGLEAIKTRTHNFWLVTSNEDTYNKYKPHNRLLLLVKDLEVLQKEVESEFLFFDNSFTKEQLDRIQNFKVRFFEITGEDEAGRPQMRWFQK